jgi:subtilisin family serine protease
MGLLAWSTVSSCADATPIQVGKYKVHPTKILARYSASTSTDSAGVALQSLGLAVQRQYATVPGLVVLDSAAGARMELADPASQASTLFARIQALQQTGLFDYVQPNYIYTNLALPNDASFVDGTLWGLRNTGANGGTIGADIGVVKAWNITTGSRKVIVGVVDSGIRYTHQELVNQMWHNPNEITGNGLDDDRDGYADDIFGVNAPAQNGDPFDDNDHGTHVSGTIGAAANDGNPHVGVTWHVQLMACKFLAAEGFGTTADAITCIDYAVQHGARILNNSWGGGPYERALFDSIDAARHAGVLFVAAAANDGTDNDLYPVYPASYKLDNIIAVAALDRNDQLVWFSNYGHNSVHLGAPGVDIFSCVATSDNAYDTFSGTSMAAPHVTGVAALILAAYPNASVPELRQRLLSTAVKIPSLDGLTVTGGRVNAYAALSAAPDGVLELAFDPPENSDLSARRPVPFFVTVTDLAGITNATVTARVAGASSDVTFLNNGTGSDFKALDEVYTADLTLPTASGAFDIVFTITAPGKQSVTRTVSYNIASPPLNDNFADALDLPPEGSTLQWTNRFATMEAGEPLHAQVPSVGASVWWNWTPAANTPVIVDTTGSAFDTVVAVYTNSTLAKLKEVASADDAGGHKQGYAMFNAIGGTAYHIAVAGFTSAEVGAIKLRVQPGGAPDTNGPQLVITGPATGLIVTNLTDAKVVVTGTALDPDPNASGVKQVQVQLNRDVPNTANGTTNWASTVLLREGQNRIRIIASDFAGNSSAANTLIVTYQPLISPNDNLTNATELVGDNGSDMGNNSRATKEPGEPKHAGNAGGKSIWWLYRPAVDGILSLTTANSTFNTLLAVYTAKTSKMDDLQWIASNDDDFAGSDFSRLAQPIKGQETYYIAVDGFNGSTGIVQLAYSFTPARVYTLKVNASDGGVATPMNGYFAGGDRVVITATPNQFFSFDHWEGGVTSSDSPLAVVMQSDLELTPRFQAIEFSDGFETGNLSKLPWKTSGNLPWTVQTNLAQSGKFAARSGAIGNGQKSSLILTTGFRAGTGSFGFKVSSEPVWDVLGFYVNGRVVTQWSGEVGWTNYQFNLPAGTNTLEWRYSKDFLNTKQGLDSAFIDSLDLPLAVAPDASAPARLVFERLNDGSTELDLSGQTNQLYLLQSSPDLKNWQSVSTNIARAGTIRWNLPSGSSNQFYRALVP